MLVYACKGRDELATPGSGKRATLADASVAAREVESAGNSVNDWNTITGGRSGGDILGNSLRARLDSSIR